MQSFKSKFEIYKDKSGGTRLRFKAPNGEVMISGQGYKQKKSAVNAVESIKKTTTGAEVDDQTEHS